MCCCVVSTLGNDWTLQYDNNIIIVNTHTHTHTCTSYAHTQSQQLTITSGLSSSDARRFEIGHRRRQQIVRDLDDDDGGKEPSMIYASSSSSRNLAVSHRDALDRRAVITALGQILLLRSFVIAVASTMSRARDSHTSLRH